jgi:MEMO1 family protein
MDKQNFILFAVFLFFQIAGNAQESAAPQIRQPAFAGTFYPSTEDALSSRLQELFEAAGQAVKPGKKQETEGSIRSLVLPHAGFDYSGTVAAAGYLQLPKDSEFENIFIITTSHRRPFEGISVCTSSAYRTPLGDLQVNQQIAHTLIKQHKQIAYHEAAHEREQGIEVQLPFIQFHFEHIPSIVPVIMGASSLAGARTLASALLPWFTPENLFIISADFSRYPSYSDAVRLDQLTADAVISGNPEQFYNTLREVSNMPVENLSTPSGDWSSILSLLYMADHGDELNYKPLLYQNSGDSPLGKHDRVVGYWAIAGLQKLQSDTPFALSNEEEGTLLEISRSTLESFIKDQSIPRLPSEKLSPGLKKPGTVLVSLYMGNRLRGRLEYLSPAIPLGAMVQEMTIAAATLDKRFVPVEESELPYVQIEISLLSPLKKISSIHDIDPDKHGIYLLKNDHSGLYLPGTAEKEQWSIEELLGHCAREKAGLGWEEWKDADLYIFEATTFREAELNPSIAPAL